MKKTLLLLGAMVIISSSMFAAACTNTTLDVLTTGGFTCTVDDKTFSNFQYTPLAGAPAASAVDANTSFSVTTQNFGWSFAGAFNGNFTLAYTVAVDTAICSTCRIDSAREQIFAGQNPVGTQVVNVAEGAFGTVSPNNASLGDNTKGMAIPLVISLTKTLTSANLTTGNSIVSIDSSVHQISGVPEPMTLSMMGIGLLGLGLLRRRQMGKK